MIDFDQIPVLAPSQAFERLGEDRLLLFGDSEHAVFDGRDLVEVASLVDGRRTKAEVLELASRRMGDVQALSALYRLEESGRLVAAAPGADRDAMAFWHALGAELPGGIRRLREARVRVDVSGRCDTAIGAELQQALRDAGIEPLAKADPRFGADSTAGSREKLEVRLVEDYLDAELDEVNRQQLAAGARWCLVNPFSAVGWIGPVFTPGEGPCWACLAHRLRSNRPVHEYIRSQRRQAAPVTAPSAHLKVTRRLLLDLAALAIARTLASTEKNELCEQLLAFDCRTLEVQRHFVARRPQCPVCGDPGALRARASRPVALAAIPKSEPHEGGYRQHHARDAFERHRRLVSPYVGAVSFLEPMPGRDSRLQAVYVSGYAVPPGDDAGVASCLRVCAGKGRSHEQARMSALSEAVERRSGQYDGDEPRMRASLAELGDSGFAPALLHGFSERQYAERSQRNATARDRSQWVPEPLNATTAIDWTPAWSLRERVQRYVPFTYCFAGAPPETGTTYCPPNGNGVAAGTSLEEAILQALLELVERDAVAIWWYNALRRPAWDLSRLRDPYVDGLLAHHRRQGAEVWALDLTHDLGIPVCAAIRHDGQGCFGMGFGCHLDFELAVQRALTELSQLGDGKHPGTGKPLLDTASLPDRSFLFPGPAPSHGSLEDVRFDSPHLAADIEECLQRLGAQGLDAFVVDKTRPDFGLHVAQVIVPGLRHFWPRFAPGRLYDVPVALGWRAHSNSESCLNPVPMLL